MTLHEQLRAKSSSLVCSVGKQDLTKQASWTGIMAMYFTLLNLSLTFFANQTRFHLTREISGASKCQFCMNLMPIFILLPLPIQLSLSLVYVDGNWCQQSFFPSGFYRAVHTHAVCTYLHSLGSTPNGGCSQACRQHIAEVKPPGCNKKFCPWGKSGMDTKSICHFLSLLLSPGCSSANARPLAAGWGGMGGLTLCIHWINSLREEVSSRSLKNQLEVNLRCLWRVGFAFWII